MENFLGDQLTKSALSEKYANADLFCRPKKTNTVVPKLPNKYAKFKVIINMKCRIFRPPKSLTSYVQDPRYSVVHRICVTDSTTNKMELTPVKIIFLSPVPLVSCCSMLQCQRLARASSFNATSMPNIPIFIQIFKARMSATSSPPFKPSFSVNVPK